MRSWAIRFLAWFRRYVLVELPTATRAEHVYAAENLRISGEVDKDRFPRIALTYSAINRLSENESARRKTVEEKARGNLMAVTVSATLVFAGLSFISNQGSTRVFRGWPTMTAILLLFMLAICYFVVAAISAVKALDIGESYSIGLEEEELPPEILQNRAINYLYLNRNNTNLKANWTSVSYSSIRNAVISLFALAVTVAILLVWPAHPTVVQPSPVAPSITINQTETGLSTPAPNQTRGERKSDKPQPTALKGSTKLH